MLNSNLLSIPPKQKNDLKKLRGRIFIYRAVRRVHLLPKIKNVRHLSNSPWSHKLNFMKTSGFHQYFRFHLYRKVIQSTRTHFLMTHGKFWYRNIVGFIAKYSTSGFEDPTGSGKIPHAIARVELYTPPKFHAKFRAFGEVKWDIQWHRKSSR